MKQLVHMPSSRNNEAATIFIRVSLLTLAVSVLLPACRSPIVGKPFSWGAQPKFVSTNPPPHKFSATVNGEVVSVLFDSESLQLDSSDSMWACHWNSRLIFTPEFPGVLPQAVPVKWQLRFGGKLPPDSYAIIGVKLAGRRMSTTLGGEFQGDKVIEGSQTLRLRTGKPLVLTLDARIKKRCPCSSALLQIDSIDLQVVRPSHTAN
jgi:hypothetical protein